jgi:hypothetical protein
MLAGAGLLMTILWQAQIEPAVVRERPVPTLYSGPRFHAELERSLAGSWSNVELRSVLNKIANERRIAILLDRRIDPTVQLPIDLANRPLRDGLQDVARLAEAAVSVAEPVVYIGPTHSARVLRTAIELRTRELHADDNSISEKRRFELTKRHTLHWQDLDTPSAILQRVADQYRLTIRGREFVSHDLWAGSTLPDVNAIEALSLVLIQFDLTFTWAEAGQVVELVKIPEQVLVDRRHRVKGRSLAEALKLLKQRWPNLELQSSGGSELVVRATVEDHETMTTLLNGSSKKSIAITGPAPIRQRRFTLKVDQIPVRDLMKKLEESDIIFEYDAAALKTSGIDLGQSIRLEIEKASADEFFKAIFGPLHLSVEIDDLTVRLAPN